MVNPSDASQEDRFWEKTPLTEMSETQWESLCDGCGRCCLIKLQDEETDEIFTSDVHCRLFNSDACRCNNYAQRFDLVSDCVKITAQNIPQLSWMPSTCAYRRIFEGRGLAWWHPLVSGDPRTVEQAGISIRKKTVPEGEVKPGEWEDHIAPWTDFDPDE